MIHLGLGIQAAQAQAFRSGSFYPGHGLDRIVEFHERQDRRYAKAAREASERHGKPVLSATEQAYTDRFYGNSGPVGVREEGRLCYPSAHRAVAALRALVDYAEFRRAQRSLSRAGSRRRRRGRRDRVLRAREVAALGVPARARRDPGRLRRRGARPRRDRRLRLVHGRAQRPAAALGRARRALARVDLAALGRRRQQHGGGGAARRRGGLGGLRTPRDRLPRAGAGAVRPLRPVARGRPRGRGLRLPAPLRTALAGAGVRAPHAPLPARPRHLAAGALRDRAGCVCQRAAQPARDPPRAAAHARGVLRRALDRGAVSSATTAVPRTTARPRSW